MGLGLNLLAVVSLTSVFLFSGVVFGWASFNNILVKEGYYHVLCSVDVPESATCDAQVAALNKAFTIASTAVSIAALPAGWFVDKCGPVVAAALAAALNIIGFIGIAISKGNWHGYDFDGFLYSLVLVAIGGSLTMFNGYQVPFLFPEQSTLIIEINSCLFDASTIIFPIFKILYDSGVSFSALFWGYAALAVLVFFALICLWSLSYAQLMAVQHAAGEDGDTPRSPAATTNSSPLASKPLRQQMRTVEFFAIMVYSIVQVPRSNLYMGSVDLVNQQIAEGSGQIETLQGVATVIGLVIPFGFVSVPLIELCIHRAGLIGTLQITTAIGILYNAMQFIPDLYAQLGTVVVFAAWRAFLFSIISAYNAGYFGPRTMGRVMGVCFLLSGVANLLQSPAIELSLDKLDGNFRPMLLGSLAITAPLPLVAHAVLLRQRRRGLSSEAAQDMCRSFTATDSTPRRRMLVHATAAGSTCQVTTALAVERSRSLATSTLRESPDH